MAYAIGSSNWGQTELRNIWNNLFNPDLYARCNTKDDNIQAILMLLETSLESVKQLGSRFTTVMGSYESTRELLEFRNKECEQLRDTVVSLQNQCGKCSAMKVELMKANRKAEEASDRMNSIAKILNLGMGGNSAHNPETADLVTQMIEYNKSPQPKKRQKSDGGKDENAIPVSANVGPYESLAVEAVKQPIVIPETSCELENRCNNQDPPRAAKEESGPVIPSIKVKKKKLSQSVNLPLSERTSILPKKNLSAGSVTSSCIPSTPPKPINFNLPLESGTTVCPNKVLDKIWFDNSVVGSDKEADAINNIPQNCWKLKEAREVAKPCGGKRLKQMKLGISSRTKKSDLSKRRGFCGGESSIDLNLEENEEIVLPSPEAKSKKGASHKLAKSSSCVFAPMATSTQIPNPMELSFDRIPIGGKESPNYKYKQDPVRSKEEKAKLEGVDCKECAEYHKATVTSPTKLQEKLNKCSRHRHRNLRGATPPGFWDPCISDTP